MLSNLQANGLFDLRFNVVPDQGQVELIPFTGLFHLPEIQGGHHLILVAFQQQFACLQDGVGGGDTKNSVRHGEILYLKNRAGL